MSFVVKRALKLNKDMRGNALKIIVSKPVESTEEPRGDRGGIPAGRSKERRGRVRDGAGEQGLNKGGPAIAPAIERDPRGPEHCRTVYGHQGSNGEHAILFKLKGAMNAISMMRDFKDLGNGPGL